jgi:hypothetical protein
LVGKRHVDATLRHELAFANHVHRFDASQDGLRRSKRFVSSRCSILCDRKSPVKVLGWFNRPRNAISVAEALPMSEMPLQAYFGFDPDGKGGDAFYVAISLRNQPEAHCAH